jgi:acetylornithine deacetylase/succinyl-diaminopimelate desuccinylase-like protein
LRFPSISTDPAHAQDVRRTALWLRAYLEGIGLQAEIWESPGHPAVFASHSQAGPGRPTVLLYHHYDVQPVDPLEQWTFPPFEPTVRDGQMYARGAQDNKGQCFYTLAALKAFLALSERVGCNVKVFIEGEEESGGSGTHVLLQEKREALRADHLLVIDLDLPGEGTPGITLGLRGIAALHVECANAAADLHSGSHGGIALNPNRALVQLLAKLWDAEGKVAVPGFYDAVRPWSAQEEAQLDLRFDPAAYSAAFGVHAFAPEPGYSLRASNWLRPTMEINGLAGGYAGEGFKTVIPARAVAKLSCRLVPDQDPRAIGHLVEVFLKERAPDGVDLRVQLHHGGPPFRSRVDSAIAQMANAAYAEVFGKPCVHVLAGGSVPIVPALAAASGGETVLMGFGLPQDNIHAPDEHFGLDRFEMGFLTVARILSRLSCVEN